MIDLAQIAVGVKQMKAGPPADILIMGMNPILFHWLCGIFAGMVGAVMGLAVGIGIGSEMQYGDKGDYYVWIRKKEKGS